MTWFVDELRQEVKMNYKFEVGSYVRVSSSRSSMCLGLERYIGTNVQVVRQTNFYENNVVLPAYNIKTYDGCELTWAEYDLALLDEKPAQAGGDCKMLKSLKSYYEKYQETIITVALVFALDHYVFDGKFKAKLDQIMETLISKATKGVEEHAKAA